MAAKLITLEEAAARLGIAPAELNSLRERHEVHAYRDGMSWKFKEDEIERLKGELADRRASSDSGELLDLPLDLDEPVGVEPAASMDEGEDLVLASEFELGESDPSTSSTIIGRPGSRQSPAESDIRISTKEDLGSDVKLVPDVEDAGSSGVRVVPAGRKPGGSSSLKLAPSDSGTEVAPAKPAAPAKKAPAAKKDEDISLTDPRARAGVTRAGGSDVKLADDEDETYALQGPGSDVTKVSPADSGISLASPADSGLSLEVPLDLGSSAGEVLELGGEDDSDFELLADSSADTEAVGELPSDDEFLLTPLGEEGSDESSDDSGSQVIALDAAEDFEDSAAMLGESPASPLDMPVSLDEDMSTDYSTPAAGLAPAGAAVVTRPGELVSFTLGNVITMAFCLLFLVLGGMMTYDLTRNMWSWDQPYTVNSSIMDFICNMIGI